MPSMWTSVSLPSPHASRSPGNMRPTILRGGDLSPSPPGLYSNETVGFPLLVLFVERQVCGTQYISLKLIPSQPAI